MKKDQTKLPVLLLALFLTLSACQKKAEEMPKPIVKEKAVTHELMLTTSQKRLANITTTRVKREPIDQSSVINGRIVRDETTSERISSRAAGRIERLLIREEGVAVSKGQPLYTLYSETLLTLQRELLLASEQYRMLGQEQPQLKAILEAAEKKLLLYGLTPLQVNRLKENDQVPEETTFYSPVNGIVAALNVTEGQYVSEGQTLFEIENYKTVWVEAELYPSESQLIKRGGKITVWVSGFASPEDATVSFLSPEYGSNSQILAMRASLVNSENRYKPGMQAQVALAASTETTLVVPVDAVIRNEEGAHVYKQTAENTYAPQRVLLGRENARLAEVTDGLKEGDTVVATGAYLLYSEIMLKHGGDPMAHQH